MKTLIGHLPRSKPFGARILALRSICWTGHVHTQLQHYFSFLRWQVWACRFTVEFCGIWSRAMWPCQETKPQQERAPII